MLPKLMKHKPPPNKKAFYSFNTFVLFLYREIPISIVYFLILTCALNVVKYFKRAGTPGKVGWRSVYLAVALAIKWS
jgi:hypothetical protein